AGLGGFDQLRRAQLPVERRGQPQRLRPRFRRAHDRGLRTGPGSLQGIQLPDVEEPAAEGKAVRGVRAAHKIAAARPPAPRTRRLLAVAACMLLAGLPCVAPAQRGAGPAPADAAAGVAVESDAARLACYDRAFRRG